MRSFVKTLVNISLVVILLGALIWFWATFIREAEPDAVRYLRLENEIKAMQQWFIVWTIVRFSFGVALSVSMLALAGFGLSQLKRVERLSYEHGLLPAILKDVTPWYLWLVGARRILPINLNHAGAGTALIDITARGVINVETDNMGMDQSNQKLLVDGVHSVQRHAAGRRSGETVGEVKGRLGIYDRQPKPPAALPAPTPITEPARLLTLNQAIHHPDGAVLGQNHKTGELALYSPRENGHLSIWGGTGQGKSGSVGMTAALWLINNGYHVLILDIDKGKTWGVLDGWAEFQPTDETLFPSQCNHLMREWKRRTDLLATHSAYDWSALPPAAAYPPMAVIVEEYGALRNVLQAAGSETIGRADKAFSVLARRGRAAGIYLVLLDQKPEKWPDAVMSNCSLNALTFAQGIGKGNAVGYYHAHTLRKGEFFMNGQTFDSYMAAPEAVNLLRAVPQRIKTSRQPAARPAPPSSPVPHSVYPGEPSFPAVGDDEDEGNEHRDGLPEDGQTINLEDWVGANEEVSRQWVAANLGAGVNELARHLAAFHGRPKSEYRTYQSEASKWWNQFNPRGKTYVPPALNLEAADLTELDLSDPAVRAALHEHPEVWKVKA